MASSQVYFDQEFVDRAKLYNNLSKIPCLLPCLLFLEDNHNKKGPSGPPDAEKLTEEEARYYIDNLQGGLRHCIQCPREV